jgi:hypothetical protein
MLQVTGQASQESPSGVSDEETPALSEMIVNSTVQGNNNRPILMTNVIGNARGSGRRQLIR